MGWPCSLIRFCVRPSSWAWPRESCCLGILWWQSRPNLLNDIGNCIFFFLISAFPSQLMEIPCFLLHIPKILRLSLTPFSHTQYLIYSENPTGPVIFKIHLESSHISWFPRLPSLIYPTDVMHPACSSQLAPQLLPCSLIPAVAGAIHSWH